MSATLLLQGVVPVLADGDSDGSDPDAPQSVDAHGVSPTSIVVDFVGPDLEPDQYQIWRDGLTQPYVFDSASTGNWSTYSMASGEGQVLSLGLSPNTMYSYHVCAVYAGYDAGQFCADTQAETLPPLPPPAGGGQRPPPPPAALPPVGNLHAVTQDFAHVQVLWTLSAQQQRDLQNGTTELDVFRISSGGSTELLTTQPITSAVTEYDDSGLQPLSSYQYQVRYVDANCGKPSGVCNPGDALTDWVETPAAPAQPPTNVVVTLVQGGDHLSWADADSTLLRYEVERKDQTGWTNLTPVVGLDTPLPAGHTEYTVPVRLAFVLLGVRTYHVCAVNVTGRACSAEVSTPSASRQVTVQPQPPSIVKLVRNSGGVDIAWTAADALSDEFRVERMDAAWTVVGTVDAQNPLAFTDHPPSFLLGHTYRVCGEGLFGEACSPASVLPSIINSTQRSGR